MKSWKKTVLEWFGVLVFVVLLILITLYPKACIGWSADYKLYIFNEDHKNYYHVRVINDDTRWHGATDVEPALCSVIYRLEKGVHLIKIYKDGSMLSDAARVDVTDDHICVEINHIGKLSLCNKTYCLD